MSQQKAALHHQDNKNGEFQLKGLITRHNSPKDPFDFG